jgi:8-oxo-dGTP diphosphatase
MLKELFHKAYQGQSVGYVLVIARSSVDGQVVVVRKNRPVWQAGRFNYPGGKIERHESPLEAAAREMGEETGICLPMDRLRPVAHVLRQGVFEMFVFAVDAAEVRSATALTDEEVVLLSVAELRALTSAQGIENLPWLYDMAFDGAPKCARIEYE